MTDPLEVAAQAQLDQLAAELRQSHTPGKSSEWYQALARRMIWYRLHNGDMTTCPFEMPADT